MNYYAWSLEYKDTADEFAHVIDKLNSSKRGKSHNEKKEIDMKIAKYRNFYYECMQISKLLMSRYEGVG